MNQSLSILLPFDRCEGSVCCPLLLYFFLKIEKCVLRFSASNYWKFKRSYTYKYMTAPGMAAPWMTALGMAAPWMAASWMAASWDGCFLIFLLTLNKSKNLVVILLSLNKSKIILLPLNKSKKLTAKPPWEKPDAYAFFLFTPLPHVTGTPPWVLRPMRVSTSPELYPNTWLFFVFWMHRHPVF